MTPGDALLAAYGGATALLAPAAAPMLRRRLRRGKEDPARIGERTGRAGLSRPTGPLVWVHGASLGEGLAVLPLVAAIKARGAAVLVTTGTVTSAEVLAGRLPAGVLHQYLPLDLPGFVRRFLDHWRPDLVLLAESELWPNLLAEVARRGTPLALVNGRLSARSFARWRLAPWLAHAMMDRITLCLAQTQADAGRLTALGAKRVTVTGNVKYDVAPPPADLDAVADLTAQIGDRPAWLAASTHPDEDGFIVAAHQRVARHRPDLLTVVAPRQPASGADLAARAAALGLRVRLRSRGEPVGADVDLYIADTVGELGLFSRVAALVFVGRSLAGGGGSNPIEPAKLRRAVLHGPRVENFVEVYRALDEAGAALAVADADELGDAVASLLADPARCIGLAERAAAAVERLGGATGRTLDALAPFLPAMAMAEH